MFWNKFVLLCTRRGISPNEACRELGFSNATSTKWKNGSSPRDTTLTKIAEFFDMPLEFFKPEAQKGFTELTEHEACVLEAYRANPQMQLAVDKLLGVETVRVYMAANSTDNQPDMIANIEKKRWEKLANAPETDDTLL